ncbi:transcriptional regulator [Rhizobium tibeticum]|uniref:Transcriptional regulator n=1 Tax=Rhizobium tibeticum TaxID=501024 RepID=A0A1H8UCT1_9HYPH|nr:MarR family transcriptional regulator [Rhizobium tibeticum]SEI17059.1 iron-sulfur cluster biosynthesis transcriptional regulator SufR [Rhizobium tibeticum]SEP01072.1 transcriptional regulator [Rhizobium tibeticum]
MRQSPANRILLLIKTEGPQLAAAVAARLGISSEAVRQQLTKMAQDGLVEAVSEAGAGRGRPRQLWSLTPAGNQTFPDGHAELTATLLTTLVTQLGKAALDAVICAREAETLRRYRQEVDAQDVQSRVLQLAAVRTREGYMADSWHEADGSLLLVENHCPICAAASVCAGFCRSELDTFRTVLGAKVEREEHILLGARRCAYRITPL